MSIKIIDPNWTPYKNKDGKVETKKQYFFLL